MAIKRDISGQRFGKLVALHYVETIKKTRRYLCQCDCGNQKVLTRKLLVRGDTKSCGCDWFKSNKKHASWKGYEDIPLDFFNTIIRGAKSRNIEFNITIEYLWELFIKQDKKCKLSGLGLQFAKIRKDKKSQTCSVDRIDSSKGYVVGNVQWVHKTINIMKNKLHEKDFLYFCKMISESNKDRFTMDSDGWRKYIHVKSSLPKKDGQYAMFCGRFQPLHGAHKALFQKAMQEGKRVLICVRDGEVNDKNPFTAEQVKETIENEYASFFEPDDVKVIIIPDICSVEFGRGVGYDIIEHIPPTEVAEISATKVREQLKKEGKL